MVGWLDGWLVGWLDGWIARWLGGWMRYADLKPVIYLVALSRARDGWLVGWLVGICRVPAEDLVGEYTSAIGLR